MQTNKLLFAILLALVVLTGQAKTYKTIKAPKAMASVNVSTGELRAREVIFRDTDHHPLYDRVSQRRVVPL